MDAIWLLKQPKFGQRSVRKPQNEGDKYKQPYNEWIYIQYSAILIKTIYKELCKEEADNLFFIGINHGEGRNLYRIN